MSDTSKLDSDELLHLAIMASQQNDHEKAIIHLKQALQGNVSDARIHYMLGAEYAEIAMYDRATEEMAKAVEVDPTLVTAHFQLGLLHITSGRVADAETAWQPLDELGTEDPLYLFKTGMLHLARDEFDACVENLQKGIKQNQTNAALNQDMQRIIDEVHNRQRGTSADNNKVQNKEANKSASQGSGHVFLSAYEDDDEK